MSGTENRDGRNPQRKGVRKYTHTWMDVHVYMYSVISYRSQRRSLRNERDREQRREESTEERCAQIYTYLGGCTRVYVLCNLIQVTETKPEE